MAELVRQDIWFIEVVEHYRFDARLAENRKQKLKKRNLSERQSGYDKTNGAPSVFNQSWLWRVSLGRLICNKVVRCSGKRCSSYILILSFHVTALMQRSIRSRPFCKAASHFAWPPAERSFLQEWGEIETKTKSIISTYIVGNTGAVDGTRDFVGREC